MPTNSLGQKAFLKLTLFFPGSLWPHACSTGNPWWHLISAVKLLLAAVGSGFDSCCVSILASGRLCCHGQGFLPLCFSLCGSGKKGWSLLGMGWWIRGSLEVPFISASHDLCKQPACTLCKAFWVFCMRSVVQKPAAVIIYPVYLLVTFLRAGEWKKTSNQQIHSVYISFHFQCLRNADLLNTIPSFEARNFTEWKHCLVLTHRCTFLFWSVV